MEEQILYAEQQQAHDNLVKSRGGLLFWKVGTGKTRVALAVFATLQKTYNWSYPCIGLFVCKPKCFYDIRKEVQKIGFDCVILEKDYEVPEAVQMQMATKPTLLLVSHAMLEKMLEYLDQNKNIRMVFLDDGYLFKNPRAGKTKAANKLTVSRRAVLMSGSVMTRRDPTDVYGQAFAVNQHRRISPNLTRFTSDHFNTMRVGPEGGKKWPLMSPRKGAYEKIVEALDDAANFFFPKNSDRKIHNVVIEVEATPQQTKLFTELREWYSIDELDIELNLALQVSQKVQQISNGWTKNKEGMVCYIPNNKVARTVELVQEIVAEGERVVIWCAFRNDVEILSQALGGHFATLQMTGDKKFDVKYWETGDYPVVVATEASGVGVNHFEQVPYAIYFSLDWKWLDLQQSRGRHDRKASKHSEVFYFYMQTKGGLDTDIYRSVTSSESKEEDLIAHGMIRNWVQNEV